MDVSALFPPPSPPRSIDPDVLLFSAERTRLREAITNNDGTPCMRELARVIMYEENPAPRVANVKEHARDENGSIEGVCALGEAFWKGEEVEMDETLAVELWSKCAKRGCWVGTYWLGRAYEEGWGGVSIDYGMAIWLYKWCLWNGGGEEVLLRLGLALEMAQNSEGAKAVYSLIIQRKGKLVSTAMMRMGIVLAVNGRGMEGVEWLERSHERGAGKGAMVALGMLWMFGNPFKDIEQAIGAFTRAYEDSGDNRILVMMADLLIDDDEERDIPRAVHILQMAVEEGDGEAMWKLAQIYASDEAEGVETDHERAIELYECVAEMDPEVEKSLPAKVQLASLLISTPDYMLSNEDRAMTIYEEYLSCEGANNLTAITHLGDLYMNTENVERRSVARAADMYERGLVTFNDIVCLRKLAYLLRGNYADLQKDIPRSVALLEMGVNEQTRMSFLVKYDLASTLSSDEYNPPVDIQRGKRLYEELIEEHKDIPSMVNLAELYRKGMYGVAQDIPKAMQLCEQAIALGFGNDENELERLSICRFGMLPTMDAGVPGMAISLDPKWQIETLSHFPAMVNLAEMLLTGEKKDISRSVTIFERTLEFARATEAYDNISICISALRQGLALTRDNSGLQRRFMRVAEGLVGRAGSLPSMRFVGDVYLKGAEYIDKDVQKGLCFYQRASFQGDPEAMVTYGEFLCSGEYGVQMNRKRAFDLFVKAFAANTVPRLERTIIVNLVELYISVMNDKGELVSG